ncbi:hypothetical protein O23A_p0826 [Aeromonas salmonicida]|nr:hypothetical protein O23A_p0826 [Aeromonas salmonicida]
MALDNITPTRKNKTDVTSRVIAKRNDIINWPFYLPPYLSLFNSQMTTYIWSMIDVTF